MTGFYIEPAVLFHPRFATAGPAASWLWTQCGVWSVREDKDGYVTATAVRSLGTIAQAKRLVEAGLWEEVEGGYQFLRWRDHMGSPEDAKKERRRELDRERQRRRRAAAKDDASPMSRSSRVTSRDSHADGHADVTRTDQGVDIPSSNQVPPLPPQGGESQAAPAPSERAPRSRGTRIPEKFFVTVDMWQWAGEETPTVDVKAATRKFVDYWRGVGGQRGTKVDWAATWRNWMRNEAERTATKPVAGADRERPIGQEFV